VQFVPKLVWKIPALCQAAKSGRRELVLLQFAEQLTQLPGKAGPPRAFANESTTRGVLSQRASTRDGNPGDPNRSVGCWSRGLDLNKRLLGYELWARAAPL